MEELKYPIGRFSKPENMNASKISEFISVIKQFPAKLKFEVTLLNEEQLNTPYRPDGWTVRQVVNHCSDSHMNAFIRFKLALTEVNPVITAYNQDAWANLADSKHMPIEPALHMIEGLHARWAILLKNMSISDFQKTYIHPEKGRAVPLEEALANYAWHCHHHLAHIVSLKKRMGWK